ncbi:ABC transporter ATP-binding protein [Rhodoplanes sp. TEM]|uniref:ABC transporter ATP-binding protein n=1 Tax=Rhodoplanes tepidamans TaxID=200616 RepID=A0ABT5J4H4_RHOTP|nr:MULTISPECIES: ABC transporter ATP-binding protein [Rhodoplanes]MDC7784326.1 ABC transporter ATP-binding protein [Rhodoplanes tepidamans]MDC7983410.1 ABC transporter ATP-binding protein [Rhodoplanes sp. TEM]MDQ0354546.1 lipopolysaccharide transport system ATP-binding protein [Rhodoplanes tepidamans]
MSSDATRGDVAIRVRDISKHFLLFDRPQDRLKQSIVPRLQRLAGRPPRRYYREFAALGGVSFDVRRGETVGIVGRNGSGKSTLLQIVCGTLRPNAGSVEVNGRVAALLELGAGFNPAFTGRENVYLNGAILGLSRAEIDERFDAIAGFADIGAFIDQPVKTYSSGMYVRLAFATAINVDPDILVVDEALAVGDEAFQRKCFARLEQIQERGATILFVSHSAQLVVQLCSRALLVDRGELILDGQPKTVTVQYQRLVNASPEIAPDIRAAILAMHLDPVAPPDGAAATPAPPHDPPAAEAAAPPPADAPRPAAATAPAPDAPVIPAAAPSGAEFYDPGLRSQSMVDVEQRGALIRDVRVTTMRGEAVNVLMTGRRYVVAYDVDFSCRAESVGFSTYLKTLHGQGLAGASTLFNKSLRTPLVRPGTTAHVRFEFQCQLLPGTYFWNAGVVGTVDGERYYLHRLIDVVVTRVLPTPEPVALGVVDMGMIPYVTIDESPIS